MGKKKHQNDSESVRATTPQSDGRNAAESKNDSESLVHASDRPVDQSNPRFGKLKDWIVDFAEMFGIPAGALLFVWHNRGDLLTIILSGVAVVCFVHGLCRILEVKRKRLAVGAVFVLTMIGCTVWFTATREKATMPMAQWQPPGLPPGCSNITILFGGQEFIADVAAATHSSAVALLEFGLEPIRLPFLPFIQDNRFYIFVTIGGSQNNNYYQIAMTNVLDAFIPARWDRNFSSNEYEVVRDDLVPVLQVIYRRANVVEINGMFDIGTNQLYVTSNSYDGYGIMELWRYVQGMVALEARYIKQGTNAFYLHSMEPFDPSSPSPEIAANTGVDGVISKRPESPRGLRMKPSIDLQRLNRIFKYPSQRHLGEYAE